MSADADFIDAIVAAGIFPPEQLIGDGKLHRFSSNGKRGDDSGWYIFHDDDQPAGAFGCWRSGVSETWTSANPQAMSEEDRRAHRRRMEELAKQRQRDIEARQTEAAKRAAEMWNRARVCTSHQYLMKKAVAAYGLRLHEDLLVIPMRDDARRLCSLQFIRGDGRKRFLTGGRVAGCYHLIGEPAGMLCIVEGYATGATVHELTGQAVAVAFNAGNLAPVAIALRRQHRQMRLLICADNDHATEGNPGVTKAEEAAAEVGAVVAIPEFGEGSKGTDFNDMAKERSADAVRAALRQAIRQRRVA